MRGEGQVHRTKITSSVRQLLTGTLVFYMKRYRSARPVDNPNIFFSGGLTRFGSDIMVNGDVDVQKAGHLGLSCLFESRQHALSHVSPCLNISGTKYIHRHIPTQ